MIGSQGSHELSASAKLRLSRPVAASRLLASPFLSSEERQKLVDAVSAPKKVPARSDLVREGDGAESLFLLRDGWACRYAATREGGCQFPALLVPGDICNLDSLMFRRLNYGVRTLTEVTVMTLPRQQAMVLAAQHNGIARAFTWLAMVENTILSAWTLSLGRRSSKERLAHLLCELSVRLDGEQDGDSCFGFPLTQGHLADALGLTPVHINRTMRQLSDAGLIAVRDRIMTLPDVAQLRDLGGFNQSYLHADPIAEAQPA